MVGDLLGIQFLLFLALPLHFITLGNLKNNRDIKELLCFVCLFYFFLLFARLELLVELYLNFFFFFKVILLHGTYTVFFPCYPVIHGAALTQKEY